VQLIVWLDSEVSEMTSDVLSTRMYNTPFFTHSSEIQLTNATIILAAVVGYN